LQLKTVDIICKPFVLLIPLSAGLTQAVRANSPCAHGFARI